MGKKLTAPAFAVLVILVAVFSTNAIQMQDHPISMAVNIALAAVFIAVGFIDLIDQ